MSIPIAIPLMACLGAPTINMQGIPALCNFSTTHRGGTPTAETNKAAYDSKK